MGKTPSSVAAAWLAAGLCAGMGGSALAAPVDRVSNPGALDYGDVAIGPREMKEPFVRDGVVAEPRLFATIQAGLTQTQVRAMLGEPLQQKGSRWDYNFQFRLPQSQNFMVCQYKVVFDDQQLVRDTIWRRRQCQQLASGAPMGG